MAGAVTAAAMTVPPSAPAAQAGVMFSGSAAANLDVATQHQGEAAAQRPVMAAAAQADAKASAVRKAAAAKRAAAKKAAAARLARQRTAAGPSGSPRQVARAMLGQFGWSGSEFSCLEPLWGHESGWSVSASNPSSGAYGIPQALPGSRMSSAGPDWQSSAATQIKWGLDYIQSTYGSPCGAWSHEQSDGWY